MDDVLIKITQSSFHSSFFGTNEDMNVICMENLSRMGG
jgi:hypothetical protein